MKFTREFWRDTVERTLYTMAETALGLIGSSVMFTDVNWKTALSVTALSGIVTVLKCIALQGGNQDAC